MTIKKDLKIYSVNILCTLFSKKKKKKKKKGYFEEINGNKYLTSVPANQSEDKKGMKNCGLKSEI